MDNPTVHLDGYKDAVVLYKKSRMSNGKWLYAFRDPHLAFEQECAYVNSAAKKERYDAQRYDELKPRFGLVVFQSKSDLDPLTIYMAYLGRWEIETMFDLYKNLIDHDTVNVHNDYRLYATEFINFLTVIIAMRVKKRLIETKLDKKYSQKEVFHYLAKLKKVRIGNDEKWRSSTTVSYITDIAKTLCIVD